MTRLKYNGLSTSLGGSGLTPSDTTITFAAALTHSGSTGVPTISGGDYIPLSLMDPATGRLREIVYLTGYTSAATTGTITRAREGTSAAIHSNGASVRHAVTVQDLDSGGASEVAVDTVQPPVVNGLPELWLDLTAPSPDISGPAGPTGPAGVAGIQVVTHGTNPNVARPAGVPVVYWVGSATPANAVSYDFWKDI